MSQNSHPVRRRRRIIQGATLLLVAVTLALVTQEWWLRAMALPQIEKLTHMRADAASVRLTWSGRVRITSLTLNRETSSPSAPVLEASKIEATIRWLGLLRAHLELGQVVVTRPVIRITAPEKSAGPQRSVTPGSSSANSAHSRVPDLRFDDAVFKFIQTNEDAEQPSQVVTLTGDGSLRRRAFDDLVSDLTIELTGDHEGVLLAGWINPSQRTGALSAKEIDLPRWIDTWSFDQDEEKWRSICTAGQLAIATLTYSPAHGFVSRLVVDDVELALPSPKRDGHDQPPYKIESAHGDINIRSGAVHARFTGLIDGLRTEAVLAAQKISTTTPFRIDFSAGPFLFDQEWAPIKLAPDSVHTLLDEFSAPSAELEGVITLRRDKTSSSLDSGISIAGEIQIAKGSVSVVEFPYPIHDIAGVVRFDDSTIWIDQLTGVGPTGTRILATGTVSPSANGVGLNVTIHSENTPVDNPLLAALGTKKRAIVEELFDRELFNHLNDEGVFVAPDQRKTLEQIADQLENDLKEAVEGGFPDRASGLRSQLAEVNTRRSAPEFDVGGFAQIDTTITRRAGDDQPPRIEANVRFDRVGIVHRSFPYPLWIEPLEVHLGSHRVEIIEAPLVGLTGATGSISGAITYDPEPNSPELVIELEQTPVDETLLSALALAHGDHDDHDTFLNARSSAFAKTLRRLRPAGTLHGMATVSHTHAGAEAKIFIPLDGLRLRPSDGADASTFAVDDFSGQMRITHDGVRIDDAMAMVGQSPVHFTLTARNEESSPIDVTLRSDPFRIDEPIEELIGAFDPPSANRLREARAALDLHGHIALLGQLSIGADAPQYTFELTPSGDLTTGSEEEQTTLTPIEGRVIVEQHRILFDDLTYAIKTSRSPASGQISVAGETFSGEDGGQLSFETTNFPIGSSVVDAAFQLFAPTASAWMAHADPHGRLDASLSIEHSDDAWRVNHGSIRPHALSFNRHRSRIAMEIESGEITIDPGGGAIDNFRAQGEQWSINANGHWFAGATPGVEVQFSIDGDRLSDDLVALLPAKATDFMKQAHLKVEHGFSLQNAILSINAPSNGADVGAGFRDGVRFEGEMQFNSASLNAGASFSNADGGVHLVVSRPPQVDSVSIDANFRLDRLRADKLTLTNITGRVHTPNRDLRALNVDMSGLTHRGRLWSTGVIQTADASSQTPAQYEFDVRVAGVDLDSAMQDFTRSETDQKPVAETHRGHVDGSMVFAGEWTDASLARGEGDIRILGGELARLPLLIRVLEVGNLIPSSSESLDYARAHFTMQGNVLTFDQILAVSPTMSMIGRGTVTTPDMALDLRFGSSGNRRLPVLSDVFDALRNELLTTRVRGTLTDPSFNVVQLSSTRRWLSRLLGLNND